MDHGPAFDKLATVLHRALEAPTVEETRTLIADALQRSERLARAVATAASKRGRIGGNKTAERGPDYYRQIAAKRKTFAGGRPKKNPSAESTEQ